MKEFHIYKDIRQRTNGEIYLGVVGPVRTGKSTFIRRFMEEMVIPHMEHSRYCCDDRWQCDRNRESSL